jgi:hypothetical protein
MWEGISECGCAVLSIAFRNEKKEFWNLDQIAKLYIQLMGSRPCIWLGQTVRYADGQDIQDADHSPTFWHSGAIEPGGTCRQWQGANRKKEIAVVLKEAVNRVGLFLKYALR